jgi:signal transduction histidine kinase
VTAPSPMRVDPTVLRQDLRLALVVALVALVGFGVSLDDGFQIALLGRHPAALLPGPRALLEVAVETLPLTLRRVAPLPVFVVVSVGSLGTWELNHRPEPLPLGVLIALYTVAVSRRPLVSAIAGVAYLVALAVTGLAGLTGVSDDQFYIDLIAVVGTMTLGYGISLGRARARLAVQQAAEMARIAEARTVAAVEQEKARIAREMHDILGHHLSVMVAQAAAARRTARTRPQAATDALGSIESVGREALSGLRGLVGLLHVDRRRPDGFLPPGLDRLDPLVDRVSQAGLPVEVTVSGRRRPLPAVVEASAYRIVQEALTNSLKHGGGTRATVHLDYGDDTLRVEVRDERTTEGAPPAVHATADGEPAGGYGLLGMRQRVALLGGELEAGPDGVRGFRVAARFPVDGGGG